MSITTRVLIVDDDAPFRRLLRVVLSALDLEIVGEVGDGLAAIDAARRLAPNLVLMDYHMPLMNGLESARRIAEESGGTAIVMLSSDASAELRAAAQALGVRAVLSKDTPITALGAAVLGAAGIAASQIGRAA
jgi:DNA-binding NarL/FixJ family response regulator